MRITITIDTRGIHVNVNGRTFTARTGRTAGRIERDRYNDRWSDVAQRDRDRRIAESEYMADRSTSGVPRDERVMYVDGFPYRPVCDVNGYIGIVRD
jgi:hypothetical protein